MHRHLRILQDLSLLLVRVLAIPILAEMKLSHQMDPIMWDIGISMVVQPFFSIDCIYSWRPSIDPASANAGRT